MQPFLIDQRGLRDLSPLLLDKQGALRVVPSAALAGSSVEDRAVFCVKQGVYCLLTEELVDRLKVLIAGRSAIEVGAGHGMLAKALGIPATDNRQQEAPEMKAYYERLGQPTVPYGAHVEKLDALSAVRKYQPEVVIGCWVTHRYDPQRHDAGGSVDGLDEETIIASCKTYIVIGNEKVHAGKSIWKLPHTIEYPDWLYSRSVNGSPDFIAIWNQ